MKKLILNKEKPVDKRSIQSKHSDSEVKCSFCNIKSNNFYEVTRKDGSKYKLCTKHAASWANKNKMNFPSIEEVKYVNPPKEEPPVLEDGNYAIELSATSNKRITTFVLTAIETYCKTLGINFVITKFDIE